MTALLSRLARSTSVHVGFAVLAMGGWTLAVNAGHGARVAIAAALGQGLLSGLITLLLKRTLEGLQARLAGPWAWVAPPTLTAAVILAVLVGVHRLIGTPEIVRTISLPWTVSTLYAVVYTAALARRKAQIP